MSEHPETPRRVRVTNPRATGGRSRRRSVLSEIDAQTDVGELYMRSLMRIQLRLALSVVAVLALTLGMLPVLFTQYPESKRITVIGIPLPWLLLGFVVYPCLVGLGWLYVRRAERNEEAFSDLVDSQ
jgi:hypothetical protein